MHVGAGVRNQLGAVDVGALGQRHHHAFLGVELVEFLVVIQPFLALGIRVDDVADAAVDERPCVLQRIRWLRGFVLLNERMLFLLLSQDRARDDVVDALRFLANGSSVPLNRLLSLLSDRVGRRPPELRRLH